MSLRRNSGQSKLVSFVAGVLALTALASGTVHAQEPKKAAPVFENGQAQIVEAFRDTAQWIRHELWVETEFDTDGDGKKDRVHVAVVRQRQTDTEGLKVPVIYESSPYYAGTSGARTSLWNVRQEVGAPHRRGCTRLRSKRAFARVSRTRR
jgi:X-Pro dipeptidyl-peptidase